MFYSNSLNRKLLLTFISLGYDRFWPDAWTVQSFLIKKSGWHTGFLSLSYAHTPNKITGPSEKPQKKKVHNVNK